MEKGKIVLSALALASATGLFLALKKSNELSPSFSKAKTDIGDLEKAYGKPLKQITPEELGSNKEGFLLVQSIGAFTDIIQDQLKTQKIIYSIVLVGSIFCLTRK
jgi:hypothetical protein